MALLAMLAVAAPFLLAAGLAAASLLGAVIEERRRQRIHRTRAEMRAQLIADLRAHTDQREHHRNQLLRAAADRVDATHQDPA